MKTISEQKIEAINNLIKEEGGNEFLRMTDYTHRLMLVRLGKEFMKTNKAEDILHEVIGDLIDGTRAWDMEKITIKQAFYMNIKSEVDWLVKKERRYYSIKEDEDTDDENYKPALNKITSPAYFDFDGEIDAERIKDYCFNEILKDDEDGQIVLDEMLNNMKQKQIAEYLGISVDEAEVIVARVRRNIRKKLPVSFLLNTPEYLRK